MENPPLLTAAVITGGHAFDVPHFHRLFRRLEGIDAYIQTMDDFAAAKERTRDSYDAVVFYHMLKAVGTDEKHPWEQGKARAALEHLRETGQGMVALHHSLLAYPEWPGWRELTGIAPDLASYRHGQSLRITVADPSHPVTAGLSDWQLIDETYAMPEPDPGSHALLKTDHPESLKTIAWAREWGKGRVVCCALGHGPETWADAGFERLLGNAIRWVGRKRE